MLATPLLSVFFSSKDISIRCAILDYTHTGVGHIKTQPNLKCNVINLQFIKTSGLPGSARRAMQGAAAALVDSRTRRIVPGGECLCGEPPHLERVHQLRELRFHSTRILSRWPRTSKQSRTAVFQFSGRACARQTRLSQEKGKGCERLGGSTVSL